MPMKLIVGLGNPGNEYAQHRHNIGFICVNRLAKCLKVRFDKKEGLARVARGRIDSTEVVLARPQTFMNLSGDAVVKLVTRYNLNPDDIIVIHDDMDLKLGQIRIRQGGSSGGHKGISSIIDQLGSDKFIRVRIGVGHPQSEDPRAKEAAVVNFVLEEFSPEEAKVMIKVIPQASQAVITIVDDGLEVAMNRFNRVHKPKKLPDGTTESKSGPAIPAVLQSPLPPA
jgi:peptidyl-tRNA hydrolase, PTH1 family